MGAHWSAGALVPSQEPSRSGWGPGTTGLANKCPGFTSAPLTPGSTFRPVLQQTEHHIGNWHWFPAAAAPSMLPGARQQGLKVLAMTWDSLPATELIGAPLLLRRAQMPEGVSNGCGDGKPRQNECCLPPGTHPAHESKASYFKAAKCCFFTSQSIIGLLTLPFGSRGDLQSKLLLLLLLLPNIYDPHCVG